MFYSATLLFIASMTACEQRDPRTRFNGCVTAGTMYLEPDRTKEITCDVNSDTLLVALPDATPTADQLIQHNVPQLAAEILSDTEMAGARWCFLSPVQPQNRASSECVESKTAIVRLFVARGRTFRLELTRVGDAPASVTNVRASGDLSQ